MTVPQVLAMMVDLEEEPDWSMQDEPEEEDTDRWEFPCMLYYDCVYQGCLFLLRLGTYFKTLPPV